VLRGQASGLNQAIVGLDLRRRRGLHEKKKYAAHLSRWTTAKLVREISSSVVDVVHVFDGVFAEPVVKGR